MSVKLGSQYDAGAYIASVKRRTLPPSSPLLNWLVVSSMLKMKVNWLDWKPSAPPFITNDTNDVVESFTSQPLTQARLTYVEVAGSEMGLYPTVYAHLLDALLTNAKRTTNPINFRTTQQYAFDQTKNASSDFVIYVLELDVSVSVHVLYTYPFIMCVHVQPAARKVPRMVVEVKQQVADLPTLNRQHFLANYWWRDTMRLNT